MKYYNCLKRDMIIGGKLLNNILELELSEYTNIFTDIAEKLYLKI